LFVSSEGISARFRSSLNILTHFAWAYAANNLVTGLFQLVFRHWEPIRRNLKVNVQKWVRSGKNPTRNDESMIKGYRRDT